MGIPEVGGPLETTINIIYMIKLPYWGFLAWVKHHLITCLPEAFDELWEVRVCREQTNGGKDKGRRVKSLNSGAE